MAIILPYGKGAQRIFVQRIKIKEKPIPVQELVKPTLLFKLKNYLVVISKPKYDPPVIEELIDYYVPPSLPEAAQFGTQEQLPVEKNYAALERKNYFVELFLTIVRKIREWIKRYF